MKRVVVDVEKLRVHLRRMSRGNLLMVAERAIELVPNAKIGSIVQDLVRPEDLAKTKGGPAPLLDEVQKFHDASLRGDFYESFSVNSRNFMDTSEGTEAFIAEFDRLTGKCVKTSKKGQREPVRKAFDILFALLRRIDDDPDAVVFFADEGGSWQVSVDWNPVLEAYFTCLSEGASGEDYARGVERTISEFSSHDRPRHMTVARRVANAEQKAALRRLPAKKGR